jgi:hypothetical protein
LVAQFPEWRELRTALMARGGAMHSVTRPFVSTARDSLTANFNMFPPMKTCLRIVPSIALGFALTVLPAQAAKKKHPGEAPAPAPAPGVPAAAPMPSERLSQFMNAHLNAILAPLDGKGFTATTQLTDLKEGLTDGMVQASPELKPAYQAAIGVCDALASANAERDKAVAAMKNSAAVKAPTDAGAIRKDNVGPIELERERREQKKRGKDAAKTDAMFTTGEKNQWNTRAGQLRESIQQAYAKERDLERKAGAPAPGGSQ